MIALRCNACGERSEIAPDDERARAGDIGRECETLLTLDNAVARLPIDRDQAALDALMRKFLSAF
jgi:hypothetical protein